MPRPTDPPPAPTSSREPTDRRPIRQRLACPRCGGPVHRRRRTGLQRWLWREPAIARFRCADTECGWAGLLARRLDAHPEQAGRWPLRAMRGLVPLLLAGLAVAAAQWGAAVAPVADVAVGPRQFAPGEAFDGEALPLEHPILLPASLPGTAGGDAVPAERAGPLALRRFCAWGRPGRMPYRGTTEEALLAARLPKPVRDQIEAAIAAGQPHDRLVIANDAIRSTTGKRTFAADGFAMTYGRTLCLGTRVNFKRGHEEPASLYEAFDDEGRRYSVMVPDVCGNVSVLRPTGERWTGGSGTPGSSLLGLMLLDPGDPSGRVMTALANKPNEVPTPGTLALSLIALAAAGAISRRSKKPRGSEGSSGNPPGSSAPGAPL